LSYGKLFNDTKIALDVKGQGQMLPKSKYFYGSTYRIFLPSYINFWPVVF